MEKALLVCNRNAKLLRLVGAIFNSKVASLRRMRKKNLIILKSLQKKVWPFFVSFVCRCWHLSCQTSIENCDMLTECTYDSILAQYCNNLHFYWAIFNWNFIWNIDLNYGACLNPLLRFSFSQHICTLCALILYMSALIV